MTLAYFGTPSVTKIYNSGPKRSFFEDFVEEQLDLATNSVCGFNDSRTVT